MLAAMKTTLVRLSPLVALLALALFPYGWLTTLSPQVYNFMEWLFATEFAHGVGHAAIFLTVGWALLTVFPALQRRPGLYAALILVVGLLQEGFQLLYKQRNPAFDDVRDLLVDGVAAALAFVIVGRLARPNGTLRPQRDLEAQPPKKTNAKTAGG